MAGTSVCVPAGARAVAPRAQAQASARSASIRVAQAARPHGLSGSSLSGRKLVTSAGRRVVHHVPGRGALSIMAAQAVTTSVSASDDSGDGDKDKPANGSVLADMNGVLDTTAVKLNGKAADGKDMDEFMMDPEDAGALMDAAGTASYDEKSGYKSQKKKQPIVAKSAGGRWGNIKSYSTFRRTFEIWSFAFVFLIKQLALKWKFTYKKKEGGMTDENVTKRKQALAVWLREGLLRLGPTFIKIGQQFSTRVDVLAPEYVKELEKLQDNVPPFPTATAMQIIEQDLGKPVNEVFDKFEETPIAAASLGQVHRAEVDGERVVVKVQRPGLKELFDIDLKNLRVIAGQLQKIDPKTDGAARDWVAIYDECARILYEEIDYRNEGKNADRFRECFKNEDWIKVPGIKWDYCSTSVLTMEYCPGIKINRIAELDKLGVDKSRLARLSVESYLQQILTHGFFHADPHPGNISVDPADGGKLIIYDFGMMGEINPGVRGGLLELFYGVYRKDPDACLDALVTMGVLVPTGDMTAVRRTAAFFLNSFETRLAEQKDQKEELGDEYNKDFKPQRTKEEKKDRRKAILSNIGEDLLAVSADQPFRFPATFTFVVRAFSVLDGIGKGLDPKFDISEIARPYARDLLLESSTTFDRLQKQVEKGVMRNNRAVTNLWKGPNAIEHVDNVLTRMETGDLKLRVRALEAERAIGRVEIMQKATAQALIAASLVNVGTVLSVSAVATGATVSFGAAGLFGLMAVGSMLKVSKLKKKELQLTGQA